MEKRKKGRGIFKLFLFFSALAALFVTFFPLVEKKFPALAEKVDAFRGYYTGPLFVDPENPDERDYFTRQYHGIKDTMKKEQVHYFVPAADVKLVFTAYYDPFDSLMQLNLYMADDMTTVIATNLEVPFAEGRQADAYSYMGQDEPDHANFFTYKCKKGVEYALKVLPESSKDLGKEFIIRIDAAEGWISLQGLWAVFEVLLVLLLVAYIVLKFIKGKNNY